MVLRLRVLWVNPFLRAIALGTIGLLLLLLYATDNLRFVYQGY